MKSPSYWKSISMRSKSSRKITLSWYIISLLFLMLFLHLINILLHLSSSILLSPNIFNTLDVSIPYGWSNHLLINQAIMSILLCLRWVMKALFTRWEKFKEPHKPLLSTPLWAIFFLFSNSDFMLIYIYFWRILLLDWMCSTTATMESVNSH